MAVGGWKGKRIAKASGPRPNRSEFERFQRERKDRETEEDRLRLKREFLRRDAERRANA